MSRKRAVIFANGRISNYDWVKEYIKPDDFIICADGGYDHARAAEVTPSILIGDMDSLRGKNSEVEQIIYPAKKNLTDSELVMEFAVENGYDELVLFGFIGSRMDHTLTNLSLLCKYLDINAVIIDENNEIRAAKSENIINGKKGDLVSVIPIGGDIIGVTTEGLEYPLCEETLYFGEGRGVSNVMLQNKCRITIKSGKGLIIKSID